MTHYLFCHYKAYSCPAGMVHKMKMSPCVPTCADPKAPDTCKMVETEGCACAEGTILSGGVCVKETECGCTDEEGNYYKVKSLNPFQI